VALTALAPIAIETGVSVLQAALQRAGEDEAVAIYASRPLSAKSKTDKPKKSEDDNTAQDGGVQFVNTDGDTTNDGVGAAASTSASTAVTGSGLVGLANAPTDDTTSGSTGTEPSETVLRVDNFGEGGCVQFAYGSFAGTSDGMADPAWFTPEMGAALSNMSRQKFKQELEIRGIYLSDERPSLFLEARVIGTAGVMALVPTILSYGSTLEKAATGPSRMLLVEYGFNAHDKPMGSSGAGSGVIVIGRVEAGATDIAFHNNDPRVPSIRWFGNSVTAETTPYVNAEMRIVELRRGNAVAATLASALTPTRQQTIADAIRKDLFPTEAEDLAGFTTRIETLTSYQTELSNYAKVRTDAATAKASANATFAAGSPELFRALAVQDSLLSVAEARLRAAAAKAGQTVDPSILQN